jgi:23S rRNA (adenine2503-C2)-methyltransferase
VTLNPAALAPPVTDSPVRLRGLLPGEIHRRFAAIGIDEGGARRIFGAAVGRFPEEIGAVRGIRRAALEAVVRESDLFVPEIVRRTTAADGFAKYLLTLRDGARAEAVWIPLLKPRASLCLSSMVGCPLDCAFCATGAMGYRRSLEADEMVGQFLRLRGESPRPVTGAVFMGMGEPLLNYDAVVRAATILCTPGGGGIAAEAITIGTAGVVPAIRRYTAERHPFRLIVSLSAASEEKRRVVMPHEDRWGLPELGEAIREHAAAIRGRVTIAWVMVAGFNTGREDAEDLGRLLKGVPLRIDLIDVADPSGTYAPPGDDEREAFKKALTDATGQMVVRRYSGGSEISAGCGQLAGGSPRPGV